LCFPLPPTMNKPTLALILIFVGLVALASAHRQGGGHKWLYGRGVKRSAASIHEQHHKYGFEST